MSSFLSILTGLLYSLWPVIARLTGLSGKLIPVAVGGMTLVFTAGYTFYAYSGAEVFPRGVPEGGTGKVAILFVLVGIVNTVATFIYGSLMGGDELNISTIVLLVAISMTVGAFLFEWMILGETPSGKQWLAIPCAMLTIYFATR